MFAMKETHKQTQALTSATKQRHGNSGVVYQPMTHASLFLQRNLGNSHLQSAVESRRAFEQVTARQDVPTIQRKCDCGGTCASCAGKEDERSKIQTKLTIGSPNDIYEQEADRVAEQVMRMPDASVQTEGDAPNARIDIQRMTDSNSDALNSAPDIELDQSGGQPLSPATRQFMEPRFGVDFGHVRLHTDQQARQMASQIQARAFTYGHRIWLGQGESEQNSRLMAHELTHVVQQGAAAPAQKKTIDIDNPGGGPTIQRDVRRPCPNGVKTVTVDMVSLRGSSRNPVDDLTFANSVFRPCCVQFAMGTGISAEPSLSDTWLGGDTNLQRQHSCTDVDPEEEAMRAGATSAFGLSSRIRVFYVEDMTPTERAVSFPPFCASGDRARFVNHAYVTNTGAPRSLAHEFGHILLNADTHTTHPGGTDNLMEPTNTATGETLEATQCATILANA